MKEIESFYEYMASFYGCRNDAIYPLRFTLSEIRRATQKHIIRVGNDFEGDSIDRETVRDIILEERQLAGKPIPEGW